MNPNNVITCIKRWRRRDQQSNACFTSTEVRISRAVEAETSRSLRLTGQPTGLFGQSRADDQYCLSIKKQNKQIKKQDRCCLANRTWGCPLASTSTHIDLYTHECANTRICIHIHQKHRIILVDSETLDEIPHTNNRTFSNLETKLHLLNFKMTPASKQSNDKESDTKISVSLGQTGGKDNPVWVVLLLVDTGKQKNQKVYRLE